MQYILSEDDMKARCLRTELDAPRYAASALRKLVLAVSGYQCPAEVKTTNYCDHCPIGLHIHTHDVSRDQKNSLCPNANHWSH